MSALVYALVETGFDVVFFAFKNGGESVVDARRGVVVTGFAVG
jgi:hypothetical protein